MVAYGVTVFPSKVKTTLEIVKQEQKFIICIVFVQIKCKCNVVQYNILGA